jgi:hypothetical protein
VGFLFGSSLASLWVFSPSRFFFLSFLLSADGEEEEEEKKTFESEVTDRKREVKGELYYITL